ncbi:MAG: ferric enterobactin receptor [Paraglaciecola sp.]|jgi:hypothetical protein
MKIQLLILSLCSTISLFAQNQISGTVKSDQKEPIYFATIALYNLVDSTIANAESSDENGTFILKDIKDGDYYLEISMLSFGTFNVEKLTLPADNRQAINAVLLEDTEMLSTVEVTAKLPLLEQRSDRLIVNVENNMTSINGNLLDVMKKVPGMIVTGDKLRMAGQSNIIILINGKTTKYMDMQSLLKDMPGDNIKKIEVIHQPGAEFDADGTGAVINIVLKKNSLFGTNGSVSVGVAKGQNWKYKTRASLSHYQGSVNINGSVSYREYPWWDEMKITRDVAGDTYTQISDDPGLGSGFGANLGLDWDVNNRHRIGFSSRIWSSKTDNTILNTTDIDYASEELEDIRLITNNYQDDTWQLLTINPYYVFEMDTSGQKLDFDVNLVGITNGGGSQLDPTEVFFGAFIPDQRYDQPGNSTIITTSLNYHYPISKEVKVQFGGKYSDAELDNSLNTSIENLTGSFDFVDSLSNRFVFSETIAAAYTKLTFSKNKWSGTLGLRYENSNSEGLSVIEGQDSILSRSISKLFPSLSIGREITKELAVNFAYSYRIDRPRYSSLNAFVYFLDPFTAEKGNQNLVPALTHSLKVNLSYEKQPFFNVEYKRTKDAMVELTQQDDETGEAFLSTFNLEKFENWNLSLFFPLDFIPKIEGYGGVIANHVSYDSKYLEQQFVREKWDFTGFLQMSFQLPAEINTEITGWYNSGGQEGIVSAQWLYGVDLGMSKKFLNDKLKVSVGVENIFARFLKADIEYANMDLFIENRWDGPIPSLQLRYKFGNQHMKSSKQGGGSAREELNRAAKD